MDLFLSWFSWFQLVSTYVSGSSESRSSQVPFGSFFLYLFPGLDFIRPLFGQEGRRSSIIFCMPLVSRLKPSESSFGEIDLWGGVACRHFIYTIYTFLYREPLDRHFSLQVPLRAWGVELTSSFLFLEPLFFRSRQNFHQKVYSLVLSILHQYINRSSSRMNTIVSYTICYFYVLIFVLILFFLYYTILFNYSYHLFLPSNHV